jgi:monoamine oxidase
MSSTTRPDVIVVGAGLAGLSAARTLAAAGCGVTVLEARDRVGGRTENGTFSDGQWIELGGQWIGTTQNRMYELAAALGLETFPVYNDGQLVLQLLGTRSLMGSEKTATPKLNPFALADLAHGIARFGRLSASVDLNRPWRTPRAASLDGQTFRTWIIAHRARGQVAHTSRSSVRRCSLRIPPTSRRCTLSSMRNPASIWKHSWPWHRERNRTASPAGRH